MRISPITLILLYILSFISCKNAGIRTNDTGDQGKTLIYAKEPNDSADFKYLKYDFYKSKSGQLCERKLAMARDTTCHCEFVVHYDSAIII